MSNDPEHTPAPDVAAEKKIETPTDAPKKPARSRGEKWRRRFFVLVTAAVVLGAGFRALLHILFPTVLDRVARSYGLQASYDKLDLSVLGADVGIWGLRFTPVGGGAPVISTAYCRGSISTLALLELKLHVQRVEAEDAEVLVERLPDGTLPLVERLLGSTAAAKPSTTSAGSTTPPSLDPPLTIDALRLQNARARFRDGMMTPATDVTVQMDLLVRDIGSLAKPTRVELQLNSPETLAALYVNAEGQSRNNQIDANLAVKMVGLNLEPARAYLEPFGIVPASQDISASAKGTLKASLTSASAGPATRPTTMRAGTLQASLALDDIKLTADSREAAGVKALRVDAREVSPGAIRIDRIDVNGVRGRVERTEGGLIAFAGIELGSAAPTTRPVVPATRPAASSPVVVKAAAPLPIIEIGAFQLSDVDLAFNDRALSPANELRFVVPKLLIEHFSTDPAQADVPSLLTLDAGAPGIAKQVSVKGKIAASTPIKTAALDVRVTGISGDAIGPYLRPLGIDELLADASFNCSLAAQFETRADGVHHATLDIAGVKFADGERNIIDMSQVGIHDASYDPSKNAVRFSDIELVGPTLPIGRDADGSINLLGIHTLTASPATAAPQPSTMPSSKGPSPSPTTSVATASPLMIPSIEIGKLSWSGSNITFNDRATGGEPLSLALDDVKATIENLTLSTSGASQPGKLTFALRAPGLMETLDLTGNVTPGHDAVAFTVQADSTGITFNRVRPLLTRFGLDPVLKAGAFHLVGDGSLRNDAGVYRGDMKVENVSLTDGSQQWLGVAGASVRDASFDGKHIRVEGIDIDQPEALIHRDEQGQLTVAGIRLLPSKAPPPPLDAPWAPTRVDLSLPLSADLGELTVKHASLRLTDDSVLPASDLALVANALVKNVSVGEDAPAATFSADLAGVGVAERLAASGSFKIAPHEQSLTASIEGTGLTGTAIERYLPATIGLDMKGRRIAATLAASLTPNAEGGSAGALEIKNARITNADGNDVDAGIRTLRLTASRVDLPGKVITIDEMTGEGAQFAARQDDAGIHALGVTISPKPLHEVRPAAPVAEPVAAGPAIDVSQLVRASEEALPLLTVRKLRLDADRLAFNAAALAQPLVLANASISNGDEPIVLGGPAPTDNSAVHLQTAGSVDGLIGSLKADAHLAPFATDPFASITLNVTGINGSGLTTMMPSLNELLDGHDLADASLSTSAEAHFKYSRRGPIGIDLTRDVTAEIVVNETKLATAGNERPLLGLHEIRGEKIRFSPLGGSLTVGSLDLVKPVASVIREADGVHIGGVTLKTLQPHPPASTQPTTAPAEVVTAAPTPTAAATEVSPSASGNGEVRIDRVTVSGVDLRIEDRVNTPHSILPISDVDAEVVGVSTRALSEARPIRFSAVVSAGKTQLPPRKPKVGEEFEEREVFAEASTNGNLTLFPKPSGYVRASISGLELTALRGIASEYGITLGGGTFDGRLDVRMKNADTFEAKVWPTFNELRMKEVPSGPIQSTFSMPAPPDVIITTIEDADGSLSLPLTIPIEAGKIDFGAIVGSAVASVTEQIVKGVAAAPLKAGKLMGGLMGMDMTSDRVKGLEPVTIEFASGESQLSPEQIAALQNIRTLMRSDPTVELTLQHELGSDDVALADQRVNLTADDSGALANQLLARKRELQRRYADESAALVAMMSTQDAGKIETAERRLRDTAGQLNLTEDGLDSVFDLLRPGADQQASRRGKAAAILLADLRLRAVQDWLMGANIRDAADRVRRSNALFNPQESGAGRVRLVLTRRAKS